MTSKKIEANRRNALKSTGPRTSMGKLKVSRNAVRHGSLSSMIVIPYLEQAKDWESHLAGVMDSLSPVGHLETILVERIALASWRLNRVARYERESIALLQENVEDDLANSRSWRIKDKTPIHPQDVRKDLEEAQEEFLLLKHFATFSDETSISSDGALCILYTVAEAANVDLKKLSFDSIPSDTYLEDFESWTARLVRSCFAEIAAKAKTDLDALREIAVNKAARRFLKARAEADQMERDLDTMRRKRILPEDEVLKNVQRYEAHLSKQLYQALHELQRLQAARAGQSVPPPVAADIDVTVS